MSSLQTIRDYRIILRHLRKLPSAGLKSNSIKSGVIKSFQSGSKEQDEAKIKHLRSTAHAFAIQVAIQAELKFLRGLDSGEKLEPRDKIRNTAARVGLSVPRFADEAFPTDESTDSISKSEDQSEKYTQS